MGQMRDADWSRETLLRSDWLGPIVAPITTGVGKELDDGRSPGCSPVSPESPEVSGISGGNKND